RVSTVSLFLVPSFRYIRDLLPFPTRRSSDLNPVSADQPGLHGGPHRVPAGVRQFHFGGAADFGGVDVGPAGRTAPHLLEAETAEDRKSTRLNSSHVSISYAVFCLKKKK